MKTPEDTPTELTETQYQISLGHSTLHHWVPNEHSYGIPYQDKYHHDTKATIPRKELLHDLYSVRPWQHELSDAVTSPHMRDGPFPAQFKPPATLTALENQSFDPEGQKMHFTGNQARIVQRITEAMGVFASQQRLYLRSVWIVVETQ